MSRGRWLTGRPLLTRVMMPTGRQVLHLLLGEVELDAVLVNSCHCAEQHRHYLAAEHVSLLEEHVGDLVAAGADDEPYMPDVPVGGMDVLTAAHGPLPGARVL